MSYKLSRRSFLAGSIIAPSVATLIGCGSGGGASTAKNLVRSWTDLAHAAVKITKPSPPAVARCHAIVCTCMFDAWAAYDQTAVGTRLGGSLRRPAQERTPANKEKAISFAAYRALVDLFPTMKSSFDAEMARLGYDHLDPSTDTSTPQGIGNVASNALFTYRHDDGSNQLGNLHPGAYSDYTGYVAKNPPEPGTVVDPDHWQPLLVSNGAGGFVVQPFAGASWYLVKPFSLTAGDQFRRTEVLSKFGSPEYRAKCQVVIDASANLTAIQKLNTEYWADGPGSVNPPGHWMVFADWVSARDNHDLDRDVKFYFLVANAVFDAGIACWDTKRAYDSIRPLTAIHYAFSGETIHAWGGPGLGTVAMLGASFGTFQSPTFVTPPFPSFPSGHSTFSASAAEVMKRFTGSDSFGYTQEFPAGSSSLEPGITPATDVSVTWNTFTDAANAAAVSRVTGGIHFEEDNAAGLDMGRKVGPVVFDKVMTYINGSAPLPPP